MACDVACDGCCREFLFFLKLAGIGTLWFLFGFFCFANQRLIVPMCRPCAGIAGYGSQVTMTMALRRVKAAPATAMSYLSVVWGIIAVLFVFQVSWQPRRRMF